MLRTEQMSATETELSKDAIRAVEEGRADHAAGRKFSIAPSRCLHGERVVFIDTD